MLAIEDRGRWLWYAEPGPPAATVTLPRGLLAVGLGARQSAAFDVSGGVWEIGPAGLRFLRRVPLPGEVRRAAISANGELIAVTFAGAPGVRVARGDTWEHVSEPDFLQEVTDLRCAEDGASFAYGWLGSQPFSEYGSYGDRLAGGVVLGADGRPLREAWDDRSFHDLRVRRVVAWGRGADPMVLCCAPEAAGQPGDTAVYTGGRPRPEVFVSTCLVGAPRMEGERVFDMGDVDAIRGVVSPDGNRVGLLDPGGTAWLFDLSAAKQCMVAERVLAIELLDPESPGVVTAEGRWVRAPVPIDAW